MARVSGFEEAAAGRKGLEVGGLIGAHRHDEPSITEARDLNVAGYELDSRTDAGLIPLGRRTFDRVAVAPERLASAEGTCGYE